MMHGMRTLGRAYKEAIEMYDAEGENTAHIASERAEQCRQDKNVAGELYWQKVTAFIAHLHGEPIRVCH